MILQAISVMADKNGSSLQAIRKWIQTTYPETQDKQKASFQNLTKKAIHKLEADAVLIRVKGSFKFSPHYIESHRRREMEKTHAKQQYKEEKGGSSAREPTSFKSTFKSAAAQRHMRRGRVPTEEEERILTHNDMVSPEDGL